MDVIIIGAGISGLYAAHLLRHQNILVIEKNSIGGRADNEIFYGTQIVTGAGIGRKHKDHLLYSLLKELKIETKEFPIIIDYSPHIHQTPLLNIIKYLKNPAHETFKEYATKRLGKEVYDDFVATSGYTDYEKEDAYDVVNFYGMEDNVSGWTGFSVSWHTLVEKLAASIENHIVKDNITRITKTEDGFMVHGKNTYRAKKVILASTIDTVKHLLKMPIYNGIKGQPFIRMYAKFGKLYPRIQHHTVVRKPLQKIIPMNIPKRVFMIAYADNKSAMYLKKYAENTAANRKKMEELIEDEFGYPVNIIAIKSFFWDIGTHYYTPIAGSRTQFIKKAQHPMKDLYVVGEMVAKNQGWTEGALESVRGIF